MQANKKSIFITKERDHFCIYIFGHKILGIKDSKLSFLYKCQLKRILQKHSSKKVFVITPFIPYYSPMKQRFQHLAELMSKKGYLVLYCTNYLDISKKVPNFVGGFYRVSDNLYLTDSFSIINKEIKGAFFYYTAIAFYSKNDFLQSKKNNTIIYDHIDDFSVDSIKENSQNNKIRHLEVAPLCDIASYSSKRLKKDFDNLIDEDKQVFIQNGVDYDHFSNIENLFIPDGFETILRQDKKIIGYHGALTTNWIDFDLIDKTAKAYPQYNIVLVGSTCNEIDDKRLEELLKQNNNIYRFDAVDYKILPQYTRFFDIAIIPFKHGEIALNTNPIKLFENMAMQIPTVVTRDLVECQGYSGVWISENDEQFIVNINSAFKNKDSLELKEQLKNYAQDATWEKQVDKLLDFISNNGKR